MVAEEREGERDRGRETERQREGLKEGKETVMGVGRGGSTKRDRQEHREGVYLYLRACMVRAGDVFV